MDSITEARFWKKVVKANGCWTWTASTTRGYGDFSINGRIHKAHRVAYELEHGAIPAGMLVAHQCDVRSCVRPDHLFLATAKQNSADMVQKGRSLTGDRHPLRVHPECVPRGVECYNHKITEVDVLNIRTLKSAGHSTLALSKMFPISRKSIDRIAARRAWKHVA